MRKKYVGPGGHSLTVENSKSRMLLDQSWRERTHLVMAGVPTVHFSMLIRISRTKDIGMSLMYGKTTTPHSECFPIHH